MFKVPARLMYHNRRQRSCHTKCGAAHQCARMTVVRAAHVCGCDPPTMCRGAHMACAATARAPGLSVPPRGIMPAATQACARGAEPSSTLACGPCRPLQLALPVAALATQLPALAAAIAGLPGIRLRGLMTIPAPRADYAEQCQSFARMTDALAALQRQGLDCDTLSMGMTGDMEAAIAQGSTLVRIGTAIFGERP